MERSGTATTSPYPVSQLANRYPGERLHVDVDGQEVVARLDAVVEHVVEEEPPGDTLSDRASLHVGERHHHRVDGSFGDAFGQLVAVQHARTMARRTVRVQHVGAVGGPTIPG